MRLTCILSILLEISIGFYRLSVVEVDFLFVLFIAFCFSISACHFLFSAAVNLEISFEDFLTTMDLIITLAGLRLS